MYQCRYILFFILFGYYISAHTETIQVNTTFPGILNDGLCSIAEAIKAANSDQQADGCPAGNGEDTILLDAKTYLLINVDNFTDGPNGLPVIQSPIVIQNVNPSLVEATIKRDFNIVADPPNAFIDLAPRMRIFRVGSQGSLTLKGLRIDRGFVGTSSDINSLENHGGAILNTGKLSLQNVMIRFNKSTGSGGGIYTTGELSISKHSELLLNETAVSGGAISGSGKVIIRESLLENNRAMSGGAINIQTTEQSPSQLTLVNTLLTTNRANQGGAIVVDSKTTLRLLQTTIYKNRATSTGGLLVQNKTETVQQPDIQIGNSVIAVNDSGDCEFPPSIALTKSGNWFGDSTCNEPGFGDPGMLDDAILFGLASDTEVIPANSVLIDAGDDQVCANELTGNQDLLGNDRLVDGDGRNSAQCDIGALERQETPDAVFDTQVMLPFLDTFTVNSHWKRQVVGHAEINEPRIPDRFSKLVFVSPPTTNGTQQGVIRLSSIGGCCSLQILNGATPNPPSNSSFKIRFQEYTYLDQFHVEEQVSVLGARTGVARSDNGEVVRIGHFELSGTRQWSTVNFPTLNNMPAVFLTIQTTNGGQPPSVRVRNVTRHSFEAALFEEEGLMQSGHVTEQVAYLLIDSPQQSGNLTIGIADSLEHLPYKVESIMLDHRWTPVFGVELKLEEEQSVDSELFHVKETVDVLQILDKVGRKFIFAQQVSDHGRDTTSIRMR